MTSQAQAGQKYQPDPGAEFVGNVLVSATDWVSRFMRILHLAVAISALVFSLLALLSCDFLEHEYPPSLGSSDAYSDTNGRQGDIVFAQGSDMNNNSTSIQPEDIDLAVPIGRPTPTFGLFKQNPTGQVCTEYDRSLDPYPAMTASRLCAGIATILGILALLLLLVEFLCCRYPCSRLIVIIILMIASISQAFTLVLFLAEPCDGRNGDKYLCSFSQGGIWSMVAAGLFLVEATLTCCTPKSVPLLRVMRDMERLSVRDPCLCCCYQGRTRDDVLEEQASLIEKLEQEELIDAAAIGDDGHLPSSSSTLRSNTAIICSGADGKKYHQDRDSGTVTLQDQINVCYDKWMKAEASYQVTLDRFKAECKGAGLDFREIRSMNEENIASTVDDYEVRRLWEMLNALELNSARTKRDLGKFQAELDALALPPISEREVHTKDEIPV